MWRSALVVVCGVAILSADEAFLDFAFFLQQGHFVLGPPLPTKCARCMYTGVLHGIRKCAISLLSTFVSRVRAVAQAHSRWCEGADLQARQEGFDPFADRWVMVDVIDMAMHMVTGPLLVLCVCRSHSSWQPWCCPSSLRHWQQDSPDSQGQRWLFCWCFLLQISARSPLHAFSLTKPSSSLKIRSCTNSARRSLPSHQEGSSCPQALGEAPQG